MVKEKHLLLIDGMALLFRGYYATAFRGVKQFSRNGTPTNGVHQFFRYLGNALQTFKPSHVICCWDLGIHTFRKRLYADYKANREAPPEALIPQFDLVKDVVRFFGIPNVFHEDYESDACLGTLARRYHRQAFVTILTGDLDLLQLVDHNIQIAMMRKGLGNYECFHEENIQEKIGMEPKQIIDYKALMGDPSDNYPGVKGIGEKTARKLLQTYDNIEQLLERLDELTPAMQKRIQSDLDVLKLCRKLATIQCHVPLPKEIPVREINKDYFETGQLFRNVDNHIEKCLA